MRSQMRFQGYPKGAIRTGEELTDLIVEARKSRKAIRLYEVSQGGAFSECAITSSARIAPAGKHSPDILALPVHRMSSWGGARWYSSHICLGDVNITYKGRSGGHNRHMLFSNRRSATEYADALKSDVAYQRAVKDWHRECNEMFGW